MRGRALVVGGSIGGLYAAALLARHGWEVAVRERSAVELAGRGAGINTHPELHAALERCGIATDGLGVTTSTRTGYGPGGEVLRRIAVRQTFTSWDRLHELVRARVPAGSHRLGHRLTRHEERDGTVRATFANGAVAEADLLVGADGIRSAVREGMRPGVRDEYAGYVCWRGVAEEADLPAPLAAELFDTYAFDLPADGSVALGYPIAGAGDALAPGRRRYNWVWYRLADGAALDDLMTDADGHRHARAIPPPRIRPDVIERLRADAADRLCPPTRAVLERVAAPFLTPIEDHVSPCMGRGRVALLGDAASVARPHTGAGVTKALEDACALVDALEGAATVPEALARYDRERVAAARRTFALGRHLGAYLVPSPADGPGPAPRHDLESLMRETGTTRSLADAPDAPPAAPAAPAAFRLPPSGHRPA